MRLILVYSVPCDDNRCPVSPRNQCATIIILYFIIVDYVLRLNLLLQGLGWCINHQREVYMFKKSALLAYSKMIPVANSIL